MEQGSLNSIQQFESFLKEMDGKYTSNYLIEKGMSFGLTLEQSQFEINRSLNTGMINQVAKNPIKHDDLGVYAEIDGKKIYTHTPSEDQAISLQLLSGKQLEEFEMGIMKKTIMPGDVVVDVGANIGSWSLLASESVTQVGKVFSFEPDPRNFIVFQKNIATRNASNIQAFATAVGNTTGHTFLYINPRNAGDHRCWSSDVGRGKICVPMVQLDTFLNSKPINILKVDTQGYEVKVLQGAKQTIKNSTRLTLFLEFWPLGLTMAGNSIVELEELLKEHRFKTFQIDEEKRQKRDVTGKLDTIFPKSSDAFTNLLCVR